MTVRVLGSKLSVTKIAQNGVLEDKMNQLFKIHTDKQKFNIKQAPNRS